MSIQHKDITDPNIHETKGIAAASAGQVHIADGTGSGYWRKIGFDNFSAGDGGFQGLYPVSDGANGITLKVYASYAGVYFASNTNGTNLVASPDSTLHATGSYTQMTGTGSPWNTDLKYFSNVSLGTLIAGMGGDYRVEMQATISSVPSDCKVGLLPKVNSSVYGRAPVVCSIKAGETQTINGLWYMTLAIGDVIRPMISSTASGLHVISDATFYITQVRS